MCNMCKTTLYIKTIQYAEPLLAPLTAEQELRYKLFDMTGEVYLQVPVKYCPFCGELKESEKCG